MRHEFVDRGGFAPPLHSHERRRQRTALSLIASITLAVSVIVAITAVSVGIAQAEILIAAHSGDGALAVAYLVCSLIVGGIVGVIYRRRHQRPY